MVNAARTQRNYDHRLRNLVYSTGRIEIALDRGVPPSTARGWLRTSPREVVSIDELEHSVEELRNEVFALREKNSKLRALLRISGFSLSNTRLPDSSEKQTILHAVDVTGRTLQLPVILRVLRLSTRRYHGWRNAEKECCLEDLTSCPRTVPHQLTPDETRVIKEMATSKEYRHVPTGTLAILAQRLGKVFASTATWYRLLDGTRTYLHGVIDNFSRRILAWKVSSTFDPTATAEILLNASQELSEEKPNLLVDGGVESFNSAVDKLIDSGILKRVLVQTEISYSNSLIESWWRILKKQWLYLDTLDSVNAVESLVEFYVAKHNAHLPHSAFRGQTSDEIYFGTNKDIPELLKEKRETARSARLEWNQTASCESCTIRPAATAN